MTVLIFTEEIPSTLHRYTPHSITDILGIGNEDQSSTSSEKGKTGTNIMENPLNLSLHEGFQTRPLNIYIFRN